MNTYIVVIQTNDDDIKTDFFEFQAHSSSEAQAYAMDDILENQIVLSVWQRVL